MTKKQEQIIKEIIDIGSMLEGVEYNHKFAGYEGFDNKTLSNERKLLRQRAIYRIKKLKSQGINIYDIDYSYLDENGIEWELDYSLQFI